MELPIYHGYPVQAEQLPDSKTWVCFTFPCGKDKRTVSFTIDNDITAADMVQQFREAMNLIIDEITWNRQ